MNTHELRKKLKKLEKKHGVLPVEVANIDTLGDDEWPVENVYHDAGTISIYGNKNPKVVITG